MFLLSLLWWCALTAKLVCLKSFVGLIPSKECFLYPIFDWSLRRRSGVLSSCHWMLLLLNSAEPALALNKTGLPGLKPWSCVSFSWLTTVLSPTHWLPEFFQLFSGCSPKHHVSSVLINNFHDNLITEAINSHCREFGEHKQKKKNWLVTAIQL